MSKVIDLTGQKFGRLTVLHRVENDKLGNAMWHCLCDCGKEINIRSADLKRGRSRSCGCLQKEITAKRASKENRKLNEYEFCGDYIIVKTNNGIEFLIDKEDELFLQKYYWYINDRGYVVTHKRNNGKRIWLRLHRLIMDCPNDCVIDHINGNPLDNRKSNLRVVTKQQNKMNCKTRSDNTSGVTGIYFKSANNKWYAKIGFDDKQIHLGTFDNFSDAVSARKSAEEKYFGEYSFDNSRNKTNIDINSDRVVETCEAHDHLIYA